MIELLCMGIEISVIYVYKPVPILI